MKNSNEMINSLFERRDRYINEQNKKRKNTVRIAASAFSLCLVALMGIGVWRFGLSDSKPIQNDYSSKNMSVIGSSDSYTKIESNDTETIIPDVSGLKIIWAENAVANMTDDEAFTTWNTIDCVGYRLYNALVLGNKDDVFAILARPAIDYTFEFENKTLAEFYSAMCDERNLPDLLTQLLKDGDVLKYGTALYETGTSSGEKWVKELYEERVKFYGNEILEKYIVDGRFLKEKLEQDIVTATNQKEATDAYNKAMSAYFNQLAVSVHGSSLPSEAAPELYGIVMYLTKDEFSALPADNFEGWSFDLAFKDNETYLFGEEE